MWAWSTWGISLEPSGPSARLQTSAASMDASVSPVRAKWPLRLLRPSRLAGPFPRAPAQAFRSRNAPPPSWPATQGWLTTDFSKENGPPAFPARKARTTCSFSSASMLQVE